MNKTIRRNWLKKQIELGKVEAKCTRRLTDDYAYDNSNNFGKTEWMPARIRAPQFEKITLPSGSVVDHCSDPDYKEGFLNLNSYDLEGKPGYAVKNDEGIIHLKVHSNLHYDFRIVA